MLTATPHTTYATGAAGVDKSLQLLIDELQVAREQYNQSVESLRKSIGRIQAIGILLDRQNARMNVETEANLLHMRIRFTYDFTAPRGLQIFDEDGGRTNIAWPFPPELLDPDSLAELEQRLPSQVW